MLSAGAPPVRVQELAGLPVSDAHAALARVGLRGRVRTIAAPGVPAGALTSQSPAPRRLHCALLSDGGPRTQSFASGGGRVTLTVRPGSDSARWTALVQDWY